MVDARHMEATVTAYPDPLDAVRPRRKSLKEKRYIPCSQYEVILNIAEEIQHLILIWQLLVMTDSNEKFKVKLSQPNISEAEEIHTNSPDDNSLSSEL